MNLRPSLAILLFIILGFSFSHDLKGFNKNRDTISVSDQAVANIVNDSFPQSNIFNCEPIQLDVSSLPSPKVVSFTLIMDTLSKGTAFQERIPAKISSQYYDFQSLESVNPISPKRVVANGRKIEVPTIERVVNLVPSQRALSPQMKKEARLDIQYWTEDEGLTSSLIFHLLEDKRGYLWIGTSDNGVSRFDGAYFTHFSAKETWYGKWINQLSEDQDGNIWISSKEDIRCYDGRKYTVYPWSQATGRFLTQREGHLWMSHRDSGLVYQHGGNYLHFDTSNGLQSHSVSGIFIDQDLNSWVYGNDGLSQFNGTEFIHYTTSEGLIDNEIRKIIQDKSGKYYFLTKKGISRLDNQGIINYPSQQFFENSQLNDLLEGKNGTIWISSNQGLFQLSDAAVFHYMMDPSSADQWINQFQMDHQGRITFAKNNGIIHFDGKAFTTIKAEDGLNINNRRLNEWGIDQQDHIWVSSLGGGISRYKPNGFRHISKKEGLSGNRVWTFEEDQHGNIWIGTLDNGISIITADGIVHLGKEHGLPDNSVRSIIEDRNGNIWIGSSLGLTKFDGQSLTYYSKEQGFREVNEIMEDESGRIWVATSRDGVFVFEEDNITHYPIKTFAGANYFYKDSNDRVWTSTSIDNEILYFQDNCLFSLLQTQGISYKEIHTILEDHRGTLWFGTHQGLYYLSDQGFSLIENNEKLANSSIISMIGDAYDRLWVATNEGLHLMIPKENTEQTNDDSNYQFFFFGKEDGIKSFDFSSNATFIDSKNRIWWGRLRRGEGVMMAQLDSFYLQPELPRNLHLTNLHINQRFIDYHQANTLEKLSLEVLGEKIVYDSVAAFYNYPLGLKIPYALNHLTFYFSALDWTAPHKIKYQYKMDGLDKEWSEPQSEPFADYRNILPGRYTLQIRAMSATQLWGPPIEYHFSVLPPWWRTNLAYVLYGLVAIALIWLFINWRLRYMRLSYEKDTAETKAQIAAEANEAKSSFLSTVTHELRTPLTSIIGFAKINKKNLEEKILPAISPDNNKMKRSARRNSDNLQIVVQEGERLSDLINELLDLAKIESGKMEWKMDFVSPSELIQKAINATSYLFDQKPEVERIVEKTNFLPDIKADRNRILQVLINLISNAVKFTDSGTIVIGAKEDLSSASQVIFFVKDSGIGIPEDHLAKVFEKFKQVDHHQTGKPKGTGLGLPICKEIIKAHAGDIWVESQEGNGSTFYFSL